MLGRLLSGVLPALLLVSFSASADETCMSPYLPKVVGQEDFIYVWTLGMDGVGDAQRILEQGWMHFHSIWLCVWTAI